MRVFYTPFCIIQRLIASNARLPYEILAQFSKMHVKDILGESDDSKPFPNKASPT